MRVLVVNAGSSSLKLRLIGPADELLAMSDVKANEPDAAFEVLRRFLLEAGAVDVIGHRLVHGGADFREPVIVTDDVLARLEVTSNLAPLHNPPALSAVKVMRGLAPGVVNVACFDTAFHATIPRRAAIYAVPRAWTEGLGVRRYGFHGLSHAYAARRTAQLLDRVPSELRVVTCHLGAGASLAAVAAGRSIDTTMGFTPLEGLVMATRSGSIDPGALLWVQRSAGVAAEEMERLLEQESGIFALAGTPDMREIIQRSDDGDGQAVLALDVYLHRLRGSIASMAAAMGGVDAVAFTGGVGEGAPAIRAAACRGLEFLGISIDDVRNSSVDADDADVSAPGAAVRVAVVHAREDLEIAREARRIAPSPGR